MSRGSVVVVAVVVVLALAAVAAAYAYDRSRDRVIAGGVRIGGVDVGGMSAGEAAEAVRAWQERSLRRPVVVGGGRRFVLRAAEVSLRVGVRAAVEDALERGGTAEIIAASPARRGRTWASSRRPRRPWNTISETCSKPQPRTANSRPRSSAPAGRQGPSGEATHSTARTDGGPGTFALPAGAGLGVDQRGPGEGHSGTADGQGPSQAQSPLLSRLRGQLSGSR